MKRIEVTAFLTAANTIDGRVPATESAVIVWERVLDEDIPAEWAWHHIAKWYANSDDMMTPYTVNKTWRDHKRVQAEIHAPRGPDPQRTNMPGWFADAMQEAFGSTDLADVEPKQGTQEIFDRHAAKAGIDLTAYHDGGGEVIKCPFPDCVCTHDSGCNAGWLDTPDGPASPCPVCRPGLNDILTVIPAPGSRSNSDFATVREGRTTRWSNGADKA